MATIRLIPSTYAVSSTSYLSVSNASNMYANTDSTTYATITNTNASTSSRYLYIRGFNFSNIPSNAIINSFTIKIKGYESGLSTSTSYAPRLANGTSAISNTTASTNFGTSSKTITIPAGSLTWEQITNYGSNFTIMVYVRRNSRNTTGYFYCYGAEIEVDYTIPVYHNVTINNSTSANVTASETSVLEGEDAEIRSDTISGIKITDNNVDVTSQFIAKQETGATYEVENRGSYGFSLNSNSYYESTNKGVSKTAAVCRVNFHLPVSATITFSYINYAEATYDFGVFGNIDTELSTNYYAAGSNGATITDSSYKLACNTSARNTSSVQTLTYTMSAGDHYIDVKYSKDDASDANNDSLQFKVSITLNESFTPGTYYSYTISNIQADHSIVVSYAQTIIHVTGIILNKNSTTLGITETEQLTATVSPSNATNKTVTWSTSNSSIATVSNGLITGVSVGTATVTVATVDGGYTASCIVTVSNDAVWQTLFENNIGIHPDQVNYYIWVQPYTYPFGPDETYRVTWGDQVYICQTMPYTAPSGSAYCYDGYAIGNLSIDGTTSESGNNEPFMLYRYENNTLVGGTITPAQDNFYLKIEKLVGGAVQSIVYIKINGSWIEAMTVYKKVNGSWVQQTNLTNVFESGVNYKYG